MVKTTQTSDLPWSAIFSVIICLFYSRSEITWLGYGDLSQTEVITSHEAKLSGTYETEVKDKFHAQSRGPVLDKFFIISKGIFFC